MGDSLVTNEQAAEIFGVDTNTWTSYVSRGQAPAAATRVMGHPLYSREAVLAAARRRRRRGPVAESDQDLSAKAASSYRQWRRHPRRGDAQSVVLRSAFDAAVGELVERGYTAAAIAADCGVSKQTVGRAISRFKEQGQQS